MLEAHELTIQGKVYITFFFFTFFYLIFLSFFFLKVLGLFFFKFLLITLSFSFSFFYYFPFFFSSFFVLVVHWTHGTVISCFLWFLKLFFWKDCFGSAREFGSLLLIFLYFTFYVIVSLFFFDFFQIFLSLIFEFLFLFQILARVSRGLVNHSSLFFLVFFILFWVFFHLFLFEIFFSDFSFLFSDFVRFLRLNMIFFSDF